MTKLKDLIQEDLEQIAWNIPMFIPDYAFNKIEYYSKDLQYHLDNKIPLGKQVFRYGSKKYFDLIKEVKTLYDRNLIRLNENDVDIINHYSDEEYKGLKLNHIYEDIDLQEAEYKGKEVELNKPKRGGSKKFHVYVKNPKTGKVKKISFGAKNGGSNLSVKLQDPEARKNFAARHNCEKKNDPLTAGYWSCRLSRFAKLLNLKGSGKWW